MASKDLAGLRPRPSWSCSPRSFFAGRSEDWAPGAADSPKFIERVPAWLLVLGATGAIAYWIEGRGRTGVRAPSSARRASRSERLPALAGAMTVGRLGGNSLLRRWSERRLLVIGALVAAAGTALAAVSPTTGLALAGIVPGAGCAVLAPTLIGVAGRAAGPS